MLFPLVIDNFVGRGAAVDGLQFSEVREQPKIIRTTLVEILFRRKLREYLADLTSDVGWIKSYKLYRRSPSGMCWQLYHLF